jgi:hypothetical protein
MTEVIWEAGLVVGLGWEHGRWRVLYEGQMMVVGQMLVRKGLVGECG